MNQRIKEQIAHADAAKATETSDDEDIAVAILQFEDALANLAYAHEISVPLRLETVATKLVYKKQNKHWRLLIVTQAKTVKLIDASRAEKLSACFAFEALYQALIDSVLHGASERRSIIDRALQLSKELNSNRMPQIDE